MNPRPIVFEATALPTESATPRAHVDSLVLISIWTTSEKIILFLVLTLISFDCFRVVE